MKLAISTLVLLAALPLCGCAQDASTTNQTENAAMPATNRTLVVYYSRTGENYAVGNIAEGNTAIVAKMIAEKTGADLFEIKTEKSYAASYDICIEEAKKELRDDARPAIVGDVENFGEYDTIYVGYPIWWGVPPMCVFTFFEKHDWTGKTVKPFCTHEGSGLGGSVRAIRGALPAATVTDGLAIQGQTAQNDRPAAQAAVNRWLGK
ncbi:MAG: flavodoxin [Kiritimatiellae bacterium]|nr:flavodoxin [Kiritimatiellia bacterium]